MLSPPLDTLLFFSITLPLVGLVDARLGVRWLKELYALAGFSLTFLQLYNLYQRVISRGSIVVVAIAGAPPPIGACLEIDALSVFMAIIAVSVGLMVCLYSYRYMAGETGLTLYHTLLMTAVMGVVGTAFAGDLLTFYVFWELMCISTYTLVAFRVRRPESLEAAFKYLIMSSAGSVCILFAMSILYGMAGTLNLAYLSMNLRNTGGESWLLLPLVLVLVGFGVKAALVPFHTWLPDAYMEAPCPISAFMAGATTKMGIYGLLRVLYLVLTPLEHAWGPALAIFSVATMTLGNITALLQEDIKRLMAYSSIAQIGYIFIGLAVGNEDSLTGALLHIFNHSFMKGLAFLCAGCFIYEVGSRMIKDFTGIGRRMHLTAAMLWISFLSLIGFPPFSGFISKFILFASAIEGGMAWLALIGILNTIISAAYYLRVLHIITRSEISEEAEKAREAPITMLIPLTAMGVIIIVFGVWPESIVELSRQAAKCLLTSGWEAYVDAVVSYGG